MMVDDDDRICGFGYQRELLSSPLIIAQNCNAAQDKIKRLLMISGFNHHDNDDDE